MHLPIIDTHAHLQLEQFDSDRDETIQRAKDAGVVAIIVVSTDVPSSQQAIELAEAHSGIFAAVGIHPNDCGDVAEDDFAQIKALAQHPKVVAIGEIGLDYYWKKVDPDTQYKAFVRQLWLAKEIDKPVIIHNREAGTDILQTFEKERIDRMAGVFHCFSENSHYAKRVLELGCYISFTGNLTYKNSTLPPVAKEIALDKLLIETDCPFMSPVPKRGKRNEPAYTTHIAGKLAEIKEISLEEVCRMTTENAKRLFGAVI